MILGGDFKEITSSQDTSFIWRHKFEINEQNTISEILSVIEAPSIFLLIKNVEENEAECPEMIIAEEKKSQEKELSYNVCETADYHNQYSNQYGGSLKD